LDNGEITRNYDMALGGDYGNVFPIFFREAIRNEKKSLDAGRPVFDTVPMIKIVIPGDNKTSVVRLIKESDKTNFAAAYERFQREEELVFDGTPVEAWPRLETRQVYELKALGFFTVESIAECSDANVSKLGLGGLMLRDMARAYIDAAKNGGNAERIAVENAHLKEKNEALADSVRDLKLMLEKLMKDNKMAPETVNIDAAISPAREVVGKTVTADLPEGWESLTLKEKIGLCQLHNFAVTPRNTKEADDLLRSYDAQRKAVA
jgi:hypothetical protein